MYCFKCGHKIEGECEARLEINSIRFYHPECVSIDSPAAVSESTQTKIAKALIELAKRLGVFFDPTEPGGLVK